MDRSTKFRRQDESPDDLFYREPRFVTHIDDGAIAEVTKLYRQHFPPNGEVLDLMSSWISHLPNEGVYKRVVGLGMNRQELTANPRLSDFIVQDLNQTPTLPFPDATFDGAGICVSIDYLVEPVKVLREIARVLRPRSPLVVTFSNRCFPTKVIQPWHELDDAGHVALVRRFFEDSAGFDGILTNKVVPRKGDPLFGIVGFAKAHG